MKKLLALLGACGLSFAHLKPYPHEHVGFLHIEDVILGLIAVILIGSLSFGVYRLLQARKTD